MAIRSALYYALAYYHASHEYAEQRKYGIQVAYLGRAYNYLAPITPKQIKNVSPDVGALFSSKQQVIGRALQQAQTDNNRIYHESVPASVPEIERKVMVKATAHVDPVLVGSEDPFLRLIPVAVSQALQQYQERQMAVVRSELDNIEDHNNLVKSSLCSMNLPGALLALDNPTGIPPQVTQRIAHFTQVVCRGSPTTETSLALSLSHTGYLCMTDYREESNVSRSFVWLSKASPRRIERFSIKQSPCWIRRKRRTTKRVPHSPASGLGMSRKVMRIDTKTVQLTRSRCCRGQNSIAHSHVEPTPRGCQVPNEH